MESMHACTAGAEFCTGDGGAPAWVNGTIKHRKKYTMTSYFTGIGRVAWTAGSHPFRSPEWIYASTFHLGQGNKLGNQVHRHVPISFTLTYACM